MSANLAPRPESTTSMSLDRQRLVLERAHNMLIDRHAGYTNLELSLKYGISLDAVEDSIRMGMSEALSKAQEEKINSALITKFAQLDSELAEMDAALPLMGIRRAEAFNSRGEKAWLEEEISNVNAKVKIKSERRQVGMATKVVMKSRTEDLPDASRARDFQEIGSVFAQVLPEIMGVAAEQARERGRLEERLTTDAFVTLNGFTDVIIEEANHDPEPDTEPDSTNTGTPNENASPALPDFWGESDL